MRQRKTFRDRDSFDVRAEGETLYFGPRTATAVEVVTSIHADMLTDCERATLELRECMAQLRLQHVSRQDAIAVLKRTDPELWDRAYPWYVLDRTGVGIIREAAEADTRAIHKAMYAGKPLPFTPCQTPLEAWQRYGQKERRHVRSA